MSTFARTLLIALILICPAAAQVLHKDTELGFQFKVPKGWKKMPLLGREKWIVAAYKDDRTYWGKREGFGHTPEMRVVVFPKAITEKKAEPVVKKEDGKIIINPFRKNPYKNFREYLKDNSYGGFYVSEEKEFTHRGMDATFLEIKFEKLTTPRRALAWIIHEQEADWVVYYEALEDWWDKLATDYKRSCKSFKFIPRTGSILEKHSGTTGDRPAIEIEIGGGKKTPAERAAARAKRRDTSFRRALERAEKSADDGWKLIKSKHFVAITHVDAKYTRRQLERAEAVRRWLEEEFGWISDAEPGKALLRICRDMDEYNAIAMASNDAYDFGVEIVTYREVGRQTWQMGRMNRRVMQIWLSDKNFEMWGMPEWLSNGISNMLSTSYVKSGKLVFKADRWDADQLRELARNEELISPREMMKATARRFRQIEGSDAQSGAFMRFLVDGPKRHTKGFLETYIEAVRFVIEEQERREEEEDAKRGDKELSEEEKEAEQAARYKARRQRESKRIENAFDLAFGKWSDKKWAKFERAYYEFMQ